MTTTWRRYLLVGAAVAVVCVLMPLGVSRDVVYCLIGLYGAAAIVAGVRRFRPKNPSGWYLIAAGTVVWVIGDGLGETKGRRWRSACEGRHRASCRARLARN